ncbi:MAG: TIGR04066 family peptide maturation system protein [Firmicutes bacterium]|nr:TIGR04066 family peptide maturation system protein [Bacillota bacterium]
MKSYAMAIYPYSPEFDPVLHYSHLLQPQYTIKALISPNGWGYIGNKFTITYSDKSETLNVVASFDEIDENINCIFIPDFKSIEKFEKVVLDNIKSFLPHLEKVIYCAHFNEENLKNLKILCQKIELEIPSEKRESYNYGIEIPKNYDNHIEEFTVPIIVIAGLWENLDKFYTSLCLRDKFLKSGYSISQVGSRDYCEMMGFHSFPSFMLNHNIDAEQKIILFNLYIKKIIEIENPDIVIITIPGAIQSFNAKYTNRFGILPFLTFKALTVDYLIMCTFCDIKNEEFLNIISTSCVYKFDCSVDCFHLANMFIDLSDTTEKNKIISTIIPRIEITRTIIDNYTNCQNLIVNVYDETGKEKLFNNIITKLTNDYDVVN